MPREKLSDDERTFAMAMSKSMLALRTIAGAYPICPRCYVEALIGELEELVEQGLDHGDALPPLTPVLFNVDTIGEPEGSA